MICRTFEVFKRVAILLLILCFFSVSFAGSVYDEIRNKDSQKYTDRYYYLSFGEEGLSKSEIIEISIAGRKKGKRVEDRVSLSYLKNAFGSALGLEFGQRYFIGEDLKLYAGAGLFIGDIGDITKDILCLGFELVSDSESNEASDANDTIDCDTHEWAVALYPELGYMLTVGKARIVFFDRHYIQISSDIPEYNMIGFSIGYEF